MDYMNEPQGSTDNFIWCPKEFDLSDTDDSDPADIMELAWINPYGDIPAYGAYDRNRSTGALRSSVEVGSLKKIIVAVTEDIVITSGTFNVYTGIWLPGNANAYYQLNTLSLTDNVRGHIFIEAPDSSKLWSEQYGVTCITNYSIVAQGRVAVGKVRVGLLISRSIN